MGKVKIRDLTNQKFNHFTALREVIGEMGRRYWECECDCGNPEHRFVLVNDLLKGRRKSCGCGNIEAVSLANKKYNEYDLSGDYGIGLTLKGDEFYFDLEDYDKIKKHCWTIHQGYVESRETIRGQKRQRRIRFHRLILNLDDSDERIPDHIDRNKNDNRKSNLRISTRMENRQNTTVREDSKTGITGVTEREYKGRITYRALITVNKKKKPLIETENFDDAVRARLLAEKKYFREFAPQRHLYSKYNIEE